MRMKIGLLLLFFGVLGTSVKAQLVDSSYVDGQVYIKVKDTATMVLAPYNNSDVALNLIMQQYAVDTITQPFPGLDSVLDKTYCVHFGNHNQVDQLITALQLLPYIEYAEKCPIFEALSAPFTPNDLLSQQYYLDKIFARDAWGISQGNANVVVAIVDNGVRTTHQDLAPALWTNPTPNTGLLDRYPNDINGWDVADNDNNPNPPTATSNTSPFGHGTLCAGLAGAKTNNGVGIASIGFNIRIMPVKCTPDANDGSTLTNAYDGVYYAIQAGADVISMSWGGSDGGFVTGENLMKSATNAGIVLVAAAGNSNTNTLYYPAAYPNVIAVAATDANDVKAGFSNYGTWVDVSAPGTGLYTTLAGSNSAYGNASGTSVAAPLVAGLAALLLSNEPNLTPAQVAARLSQTSDNINAQNPAYNGQLGTGRINAARALGATPTVINGVGGGIANEAGLSIYPNPGQNILSVEVARGNNISAISLHNITGQKVYTHAVIPFATVQSISLHPTLQPGFYMWKVETTTGTFLQPWIKY